MKHKEPKVGLWGTMCCELDIHQLDEQDIEDIEESISIDGFSLYEGYFFDTKRELLNWLTK